MSESLTQCRNFGVTSSASGLGAALVLGSPSALRGGWALAFGIVTRVLAIGFAWALISCAALAAPAPDRHPALPRAWEVPASTVTVPLKVPMAQVQSWSETAVPQDVKGTGTGKRTLTAWFKTIDWNYWWEYDLKRSPLTLGYDGAKIRVAASLTGDLSAHLDTLPGDISSDVEADAGVETTLGIGPDWHLKSASKVFLEVRRADVPIGIAWDGNFFGETISIAGPVQEALKPSLAKLSTDLDQKLQAVDLRPPAEDLWRQVQDPKNLGGQDRLWFLLGPQTVSLGALRTASGSLGLDLTLTVRPSLALGDQPSPGRISLPPAGPLPSPVPRMVLNLPVTKGWAEISQAAFDRLPADRVVAVGNGAKVTVASLEASADGDRILVRVAGKVSPPWPGPSVETVLYLTGRPLWDPVSRTLRWTGAGLDGQTRDFLTKNASWLLEGTWVQTLEKTLVWDLGPQLDRLKDQVSRSLGSVALAPHLVLGLAPGDLSVADFSLTDRGPVVLTRFEGTGSVTWVP